METKKLYRENQYKFWGRVFFFQIISSDLYRNSNTNSGGSFSTTGVLLRFSVPTRHVKRERVISLSLESDSVFQINSKPSHFMILRIVQSGHVNCPFFEIGHFVLCLRVCVT